MYVAQQLGRYHLLDRVAFGGMAEIYRAKTFDSRGNQHIVAIKRVLSHLAEDDDFLQMLVDEARIATMLDHANIAKVYEFARWGDEYFIAMEYIDGKDLRSLIDRCSSKGIWIPVEDCVYVMIRVLDALHAAHDKCDATGDSLNIIHRDVSPSNVIVSYDGQVKLCDFGIAKAKLTRIQTRTGVIKGKVRYMSPEQALGRKLDRRTDIFSAGSVLYELLTKQPPFHAESEMELIFRVRDAKYPNPTRHNPNIPSPVERILRRALAKSRSSRYQTAAEYADDLREYLHHEHPAYRPKRLGRLLRELFAKEIEKELRVLEEFIVGDANPDALGDNLLAEVLGEGAAYTQFTPVDPGAMEDERTRLLPRVPAPETRLPPSVDLHDLKTAIIDQEERDKGVVKRRGRARPGANHHRDSRRPTQVGTVKIDAGPQPDLHVAPTQILRPEHHRMHQPSSPGNKAVRLADAATPPTASSPEREPVVTGPLEARPTEDRREAAGVIGEPRHSSNDSPERRLPDTLARVSTGRREPSAPIRPSDPPRTGQLTSLVARLARAGTGEQPPTVRRDPHPGRAGTDEQPPTVRRDPHPRRAGADDQPPTVRRDPHPAMTEADEQPPTIRRDPHRRPKRQGAEAGDDDFAELPTVADPLTFAQTDVDPAEGPLVEIPSDALEFDDDTSEVREDGTHLDPNRTTNLRKR